MLRNKGFTLIEIMIILAIIGLLASISIPSFLKAKRENDQKDCIENLHRIEEIKAQIVLAEEIADGGEIDPAKVDEKLGKTPRCKANGTYTYGAAGKKPTCSIPEHELP